mmetsp:Transcript_3656/g.7428  ORF Transcript_3656/g.7428 Transcript_3656/m.7428 type:complete len:384 (-) Transcript_3656:119-1270(-)
MKGEYAPKERKDKPAHFHEDRWSPAVAIISYMISSAGTSCFQKLAINAFHRPLLLLAAQTIAGLVLLAFVCKQIKIGGIKDAILFTPVSLCFTGKVVLSMVAYDYCTLGTYVVVGSMCPLVSLPIEVWCFKEHRVRVSVGMIGSIITICAGVALYGMNQSKLGGQAIGIAALVLKTFVSVAYQTRQRYLMVESPVDINDLGMMLYNCAICLFGVMLMAWPFGEYNGFMEMCQGLSKRQWVYVLMSCILTYAIGYFSLKCQRVISATTFHILGSICKASVILFGFLALNEKYNLYSAFACGLVLIGGLWYSQASTSQTKGGEADEDSEMGGVGAGHKQKHHRAVLQTREGFYTATIVTQSDDEERSSRQQSTSLLLPQNLKRTI